MRHVSFRALAVFILLLAHMAVAGTPNRVTILYDSFGKSPTLTMDWGFGGLGVCGLGRLWWQTHPVRHGQQCPNLRTQRESSGRRSPKARFCGYVPPPR